MPLGYQGKILRIDLDTGRIWREEPDDKFYRRYLGGWGLVAYYLLKEIEPGIDPLGPKNKLVFAPGVFAGVQLSGSGRSAVGAKSPLSIRRDDTACNLCGDCVPICPYDLHPMSRQLGMDCDQCGQCIDACEPGALAYRFALRGSKG